MKLEIVCAKCKRELNFIVKPPLRVERNDGFTIEVESCNDCLGDDEIEEDDEND